MEQFRSAREGEGSSSDALARRLNATIVTEEARARSGRAQLAFAATVALLAAALTLPSVRGVIGAVPVRAVWILAAVVGGAQALAAVAFHVLGPRHAMTAATATLDASARRGAVLIAIGASGSAASGLWTGAMIAALVWTPRSRARERVELALLASSYAALVAVFCASGKMADAWLTLLVGVSAMATHTMTARVVARSASLKAEHDLALEELRDARLRDDRERMARELHDGVGADVMALVLRLRRLSRTGAHPRAARAAEEATALLDELRAIVWSLRNEQGTLAELAKLVEAGCASVRGSVELARDTPSLQATAHVPASLALAALATARALVRAFAERPRVSRVRLSLSVSPEGALTIDVTGDGDAALDGEAQRLLARARQEISNDRGTVLALESVPLAGADVGLAVRARIATEVAAFVGTSAP